MSHQISPRQKRHARHRTGFHWLTSLEIMRGKYPKTDYPILHIVIEGEETWENRQLIDQIQEFVKQL